jgi:histidinol dehydrogenase
VFYPFERVGIYVPGGTAPLVSTALMTVTLAAAAGVPEIVVCTPCGPDGTIQTALLAALKLAGATEVYRVGGSQAIAAMAYGTESIRPVAKVFGPGNSYVVEAKRQVFGVVAIDLLPGPSEVLILADKTGDAVCIAADILAQAEHGKDSQAGFITDDAGLLEAVLAEVQRQAETLGRQAMLRPVLEKGVFLILVPSMEEGAELVNQYAPEHLSLITEREGEILPCIRTAGAIFLGNASPGAVGDFLAGPSHTLPTGGAGKSFPGLTVDMFQRRTSIIRLDKASCARSEPIVKAFAVNIDDAAIAQQACFAIHSILVGSSYNRNIMGQAGACEVIRAAFERFIDNPDVLYHACIAIYSLAAGSPQNAVKFDGLARLLKVVVCSSMNEKVTGVADEAMHRVK